MAKPGDAFEDKPLRTISGGSLQEADLPLGVVLTRRAGSSASRSG